MVGDDAIRGSFARVKQDFDAQDSRISELRKELDELKNQVVKYMPRLLEQNNQILKRMEVLEHAVLKPKDALKEKLVKKYKQGKKLVIKQKLLELIQSELLSLAQLRDTIVLELGYCSRATFYRYFEELKSQGMLETVSINGIEQVHLLSQKSVSMRRL